MVYHRESSGDTNVGTAGSMDGSAAQTGRYSWIKRPKKARTRDNGIGLFGQAADRVRPAAILMAAYRNSDRTV